MIDRHFVWLEGNQWKSWRVAFMRTVAPEWVHCMRKYVIRFDHMIVFCPLRHLGIFRTHHQRPWLSFWGSRRKSTFLTSCNELLIRLYLKERAGKLLDWGHCLRWARETLVHNLYRIHPCPNQHVSWYAYFLLSAWCLSLSLKPRPIYEPVHLFSFACRTRASDDVFMSIAWAHCILQCVTDIASVRAKVFVPKTLGFYRFTKLSNFSARANHITSGRICPRKGANGDWADGEIGPFSCVSLCFLLFIQCMYVSFRARVLVKLSFKS